MANMKNDMTKSKPREPWEAAESTKVLKMICS